MAADSREVPSAEQQRMHLPLPKINFTTLLALVLLAWAGHLLFTMLLAHSEVWLDDWRYGRPRTTHFSGYVGHNESSGQPTRFVGVNLDQQVVVFELPGGDADMVRVLRGPYLFGTDEALTPVEMALADMDRDGHVDLVITVRNEQVIYLNKEGQFRLPTAEEQQQLRGRLGA
jgi:hypothetical protein